MQNRFLSPVAWTAVVAQLALIGGIYFSQGTVDTFKIVAGAVISILTIFGIFNDPTNSDKF